MSGWSPREIAGDIALCIGFFTRLPAPFLAAPERRLADAIWAAPLVGIVVAIVGAAAYAAAALSGLSAGTAAALALAATMLATGCLHEDGLADVADGFGGGKAQARKLEIMRDSRIGAYGAAVLCLSVLIRWSAIADLANAAEVLAALAAAHGASRALMPALMHGLPSARDNGLSADAGRVSREAALAALALGALCLLALGLPAAMAVAFLLLLAFMAFCRLCLAQIGGQTGDTIGAIQQIGETIVLLAASAYFI